MSDETHTDSGALSAAGRFARMEEALNRIESKLDNKADSATVQRLEVRVDTLEATGSREAREALALANTNSRRLTDIENAAQIAKAERIAQKEIADARYRVLLSLVAVATIGGIIFNAVIAAHGLFGI